MKPGAPTDGRGAGAARTPGPARRRLRTLAIAVGIAVAFAAGALVASRFMVTPGQRDANAAPPPASIITAPVERKQVQDTLVIRGDVTVLASVEVLQDRAFPAAASILTKATHSAGQEVAFADVLVEVNGRPVFALPGVLPAYEDLAVGSTGPLVTQLHEALTASGAKITDPPGTFGPSMAAAVAEIYRKAGYRAQQGLPMAEVSFVPSLPALVVSTTAQRGGVAGKASMLLAAGAPVVLGAPDAQTTALSQAGAKVRLANELTGEAFDGKLTPQRVKPQAEGGQGEQLVVEPTQALPSTWVGANVRVTVLRTETTGEVLTVPASAVHLQGGGATVVTVRDEDGSTRDVGVKPGVAGEGFVEVTGDLKEGQRVVIGVAGQ